MSFHNRRSRIGAFCSILLLGTVCVTATLARFNLPNEAYKAIDKKMYKQAIALATEAVRRNPKSGIDYLARAVALSLSERYESAATDFDQGLNLEPNVDYVTLAEAAHSYMSVGQFEKALSALQRSLKLKPRSYGYREEGEVLWQLNRQQEALNSFGKAIEMDPNFYWSYYDRGHCLLKIKRYKEALADFNKVVELKPGEPRGYASRSQVYEKLGDQVAAAREKSRANELGRKTFGP